MRHLLTKMPLDLVGQLLKEGAAGATAPSLSVFLSLCLSLFLWRCLSVSAFLSVRLPVSASLCFRLSASLYLSLSFSLSLCPSVSLAVSIFIAHSLSLLPSSSVFLSCSLRLCFCNLSLSAAGGEAAFYA